MTLMLIRALRAQREDIEDFADALGARCAARKRHAAMPEGYHRHALEEPHYAAA